MHLETHRLIVEPSLFLGAALGARTADFYGRKRTLVPSLFTFGGAIAPILVALLMARALPDSRDSTKEQTNVASVRVALAGDGRALKTSLLWAAFFSHSSCFC
jgi:MFS family permease